MDYKLANFTQIGVAAARRAAFGANGAVFLFLVRAGLHLPQGQGGTL